MLKKLATLPLVAFIVIIEPLQAIAQQAAPQPPQGYYGAGPWHMWSYGYGWHFWWMFPFMMLFFLVVCGAIFLFALGSSYRPRHWGLPSQPANQPWGDPTYSASQILNERFARGEIQKDEYTEKRLRSYRADERRAIVNANWTWPALR
jgi:putative membrane protein